VGIRNDVDAPCRGVSRGRSVGESTRRMAIQQRIQHRRVHRFGEKGIEARRAGAQAIFVLPVARQGDKNHVSAGRGPDARSAIAARCRAFRRTKSSWATNVAPASPVLRRYSSPRLTAAAGSAGTRLPLRGGGRRPGAARAWAPGQWHWPHSTRRGGSRFGRRAWGRSGSRTDPPASRIDEGPYLARLGGPGPDGRPPCPYRGGRRGPASLPVGRPTSSSERRGAPTRALIRHVEPLDDAHRGPKDRTQSGKLEVPTVAFPVCSSLELIDW
jgi:hypothetical protein